MDGDIQSEGKGSADKAGDVNIIGAELLDNDRAGPDGDNNSCSPLTVLSASVIDTDKYLEYNVRRIVHYPESFRTPLELFWQAAV